MDSLEELPQVDSLAFLPEEVPSIFQDFQDIIHMDCSTEMNGRLHNNQYSNNDVADETTKRTALPALRNYECTSCPVSSTLKTIKSREDKINDLNYLRSIKSSINRTHNYSNLYNKKYGGSSHQPKNCTNGSMVNECDLESRAPYFPHCDERLTADTHCWTHQYNNNNNNSNNKIKCIKFNNNKNKRCMKTVRCSENSKGSSLAQLLCEIEPTQVPPLECSNDSSDSKYTYSKMKNITKNNYVNPNKILQVFGEDDCQHPTKEHVDCYDCSSAAMLDLIDTIPPELKKRNRHQVLGHSSLPSSPERTNHDLHLDINISKNINSPSCCQSIPKHIPSSVSSPLNINNRTCCTKDNSKNSSSLRLLLDPDDNGGSQKNSALRALLVSDNKNSNKNGSSLRVLPVPNAPTMQQLLMSKEPIRVRGCTSAVVNPSVLHNLLATGRDVLAGYSITPSASTSEEYIISRNNINIGNTREMEDEEISNQNAQASEFSNRVQNSSESPKKERYGSQVCPDFPMHSKELIGPYVCHLYNKKTEPHSQNCRPTKVESQSSTNTTSQSRIRALFDTKESFNIEPSCSIFDNNNQRIIAKQGCNSSYQHISTQETNKSNFPEEDMDNQDPLLHSGQCAAGLNIYRNTDEEEKEEDEPAVGMNLYRNIQDDSDFSLPSLYDLTQQTDYELNTPPSSSNILQCSDLFMTLEHAF